MDEKIYTESEIAELIGKAARLQAVHEIAGQEGLTLDEVKRAAAEAGIDPRFIELATATSSDSRPTYFGLPTGAGYSFILEDSVTDEQWNEMVMLFVQAFGGVGEVQVQGDRRMWTRDTYHITVEQVGKHVVLQAETNWQNEIDLPVAMTLVGGIAAIMTGLVGFASQEWAFAIMSAILTVVVVSSLSLYRKTQISRQKTDLSKFASILEQSASLIQGQNADQTGIGEGNESSRGKITLDEAPADHSSSTSSYVLPVKKRQRKT